jgi:uncharacterized 2Fe-2S/4Fe-4S cluster protein (DUF4445 family)
LRSEKGQNESDPVGWTTTLHLPEPTLKDHEADAERLKRGLEQAFDVPCVEIDLPLLQRLPLLLREFGYAVRCLCFNDYGKWRLLGVKSAEDDAPFLGLALDLGTTRVVLRLVDLDSGNSLAERAFDNPQAEVGPDILARIHHTDTEGGLLHLNRLIINALGEQAEAIASEAERSARDIQLAAVSGNTSMAHLFLGLPPGGIIREPYVPAVHRPSLVPAASLGLPFHPGAAVFVFPNAGSYFGGDLVSGIYYCGMHEREEIAILVDVGTNAEVVLGNRDWLVACAGAAGPALEGAVSKIGMTAGPGVIDQVRIEPESGRFDLHTIGDEKPRGICGSGMIDLAAQLFLSDMLDIRGRLVPEKAPGRIYETEEGRQLVIVYSEQSATGETLTLSQADLDSLIRSKAAMYTILETITRYVGIGFSDISTFYVAGTFGSFIRPRSAITIGMIPDLPEEMYRSLGNSSLGGAARLLSCNAAVDAVRRIHENITYLELNVNQEFMNRFSAAKFLPHTEKTLFPSVKPGF